MRVECIELGCYNDEDLTIGNTYKVESIGNFGYFISGNDGIEWFYPKEFFKEV